MSAPASAGSPPLPVAITILGRSYAARPDVTLVWALYDHGYIESTTNRFCWNGTCLNCMVTVTIPERPTPIRAKACEIYPTEGLVVLKLGGEFHIPRAA